MIPFHRSKRAVVQCHEGITIMHEFIGDTAATIDRIDHTIAGFHTAGARFVGERVGVHMIDFSREKSPQHAGG